MARNELTIDTTKQMLSGQEAAKILHVSQNTIGRLFAKGEIAAIRVGNQWRTTDEALNRFASEHSNWIDD